MVVIDLHSHVLPGLDDGARDLDEAIMICKAAAADGIRVLAATPHVNRSYPTSAQQMRERLDGLQSAVGQLLRLVPGGELDLTELDRPVEQLIGFGLAGNSNYLLVETPYVGWPLGLAEKLFRLRLAGITPVLAHPERNPEVQANAGLLEPLVATGTLVQLTAAAIDGRLGKVAQRCARMLLDRCLAHLIASDAHASDVREIGMSGAVKALRDSELAVWLTMGVPGAIVDGHALPPRPNPRRLFRRRSDS